MLLLSCLCFCANTGAEESATNDNSAQAAKQNNSLKTQTKSLDVKIYAASCLACVRRIERHLRENPAVLKVSVSFKVTPIYAIEYDPKRLSEKDLLELVTKEGYRAEKVEYPGKQSAGS